MRISPYIELMKLRVVELLLISTLPAMVLAQKGLPSPGLVIATLIGGTLAAGSANAFNMIIEADSDQLMSRTSKRPIASGELSKKEAALFASAIGVLAVAIFSIYTNTLSTVLTVIAFLYYVFVYTIALKKTTDQNIVWGGAAGCMPALIGWAAVADSLSLVAWLWFFVIFFWTPPHFWALAIKYRDDYEKAKIPMLPVVAPRGRVKNWMLIHTSAMLIVSVLLIIAADSGWIAGILNLILGGIFLREIVKLNETSTDYEKSAAKIFHWSITYLTLLSILLVVAQLVKA